MPEPETSGPSTAKPAIETLVTFEDTIQPFDAYVAAVGRVAHAWNYLHERLGVLFVTVSGMERNVALSIWYSVKSDLAQRAMLRAALEATNSERSKRLPKASNDLKWLLDRADALAEDRNNAVHAPCSLYLGGSVSERGPRFSMETPAPRNSWAKNCWSNSRGVNAMQRL
jgi:hypothetical protein